MAIAHRLATRSQANKLEVLDRGCIVETQGRSWTIVQAQRVLAESRILSTIREG